MASAAGDTGELARCRDWTALAREGLVREGLLSDLWRDYEPSRSRSSLTAALVALRLLVPLPAAAASRHANSGVPGGDELTFLAPSLLPDLGEVAPAHPTSDTQPQACMLRFHLTHAAAPNASGGAAARGAADPATELLLSDAQRGAVWTADDSPLPQRAHRSGS
eukprot:5989210-Prymnesium_polylepis.1